MCILQKGIAALLAGAMLLLSFCSCGSTAIPGLTASAEVMTVYNADRNAPTGGVQPNHAFCEGLVELSLTLLRKMAEEETCEGSNRLVAGLSVATALAMVAGGAKGNTLSQMEALLGMPIGEFAPQLAGYYASLPSTKDAAFRAANAIFYAPDFTPEQSYLQWIDRYFDADVGMLRFGCAGVEQRVNDWCSRNTDGMIKELFGEGALVNTELLLLNALCFDAAWQIPYDIDYNCRTAMFHGVKGEEAVTMLYGEEWLYLEGERETGFVKPYKGGEYAFVALLPKEEGELADYLNSLCGEDFLALWDHRQREKVHTALPKFTVEDSLSLNGILQQLGMTDAFDPMLADLRGQGSQGDGDNLYIGQIQHKTYLQLDAGGTRAAAVTAIAEDCKTSESLDPVKLVQLDRPFVYGIVDTATGLPIFLGCCRSVNG